jgi:hypothetical protein
MDTRVAAVCPVGAYRCQWGVDIYTTSTRRPAAGTITVLFKFYNTPRFLIWCRMGLVTQNEPIQRDP